MNALKRLKVHSNSYVPNYMEAEKYITKNKTKIIALLGELRVLRIELDDLWDSFCGWRPQSYMWSSDFHKQVKLMENKCNRYKSTVEKMEAIEKEINKLDPKLKRHVSWLR